MDLFNPNVDRFIITAGKLAEYLGYPGQGRERKHRPLPEIRAEMEAEMRLASAWGSPSARCMSTGRRSAIAVEAGKASGKSRKVNTTFGLDLALRRWHPKADAPPMD